MRASFVPVLVLVACGAPVPCEIADPVVPSGAFFTDVSEASGIQQGNVLDPAPEGIASNDHPRLAFVDLDGDGFDDAVMHSLLLNPMAGLPYTHVVLHNEGDGTFTDISEASGLGDVQAGFLAFADVDDDGDLDAFGGLDVDGWQGGSHGIWLQTDGRFERLPDAGVESEPGVAAGAAFADFDGDGNVDLFLALGSTFSAVPDAVFFGRGDGTFTKGELPQDVAQPSNGVVLCDIDDDGDQDVLVSTYGVSVAAGHDHLWRNDGGRRFTEVAFQRGFAALRTGNRWMAETDHGEAFEPDTRPLDAIGSNGFGIDCADVTGDGRLDVWHATISHPDTEYTRQWSDPSMLLQGGADGFEDVTASRGIPFNEGDIDAAIVDVDNDGRLDLSVTRESKYEGRYDTPQQKAWMGLFRQRANGSFDSVGLTAGLNDRSEGSTIMKGAQNLAWSDIDHDGDLDVLVGARALGGSRPNRLFRNDVGSENRWLAIELVGDGEVVHRDAFGTRVTLTDGERVLVREKKSGRGTYTSIDGHTVHVGLGELACDYALTVRWPDGTVAELSGVAVGERRRVRIRWPDQLEILE